MKKWFPIIFSLILIITFPTVSSASTTVEQIKSLVKTNYVGEINGDLESASTPDEIIDMLDPYSAYFTAEEYASFTNAIDMKAVGIGVVIEKHEKGILITSVIENGSAHKSGVLAGDIIIAVDGKSIVGQSIEQVQAIILGTENTEVTIQFLREDGTIVNKTIVRKPFSVPNVMSELLYGNVGYIHLSSFSLNSTSLVKNEYAQLQKQGATSFIIDLQNNTGGYVTAAEQLIGMFPNASNAYIIQYSPSIVDYFSRNLPLSYQLKDDNSFLVKASSQNVQFPINSRLLVNRYSASASEMTTAALIDQNAAIVYGENTYGKGTMQQLFRLQDGSYLKLTIGEFFGPNGTVVKDTGLAPHIKTKDDPLFKAHFDSIVENLPNAIQFPNIDNVPTTKTFTITFNQQVANIIDDSAVTIVELGGDEIEVNVELQGNKLIVTPAEPLNKGGHYMLIVHPSIQDVNGTHLKNGAYTYITVSK